MEIGPLAAVSGRKINSCEIFWAVIWAVDRPTLWPLGHMESVRIDEFSGWTGAKYSSICQREQRATCSLVGHPRVDLSDRSSSSEGHAQLLAGSSLHLFVVNCNSVSAEGSELRMVWANLPSKDFMVSAQPEDPLGFWAFVYFGPPLAAVRLLLTPADTQN